MVFGGCIGVFAAHCNIIRDTKNHQTTETTYYTDGLQIGLRYSVNYQYKFIG